MRNLVVGCLAIAMAAAASAKDRPPKPDPARERQAAIMMQVKLLVLQHKPAEAIPLAERIIAEGDAIVATEKRRVYSGQTFNMVLSNMIVGTTAKQGAIDIGPSYGEALFFKGFALIDAGRADEAGAFLDRAVAVSPSNPQFLCEDGLWHGQHHDPDRALDLLRQCEAESGMLPDQERPHRIAVAKRGQGYVLIDLGRLDEAQARYEESLQIEPDDPRAKGDLSFIRQQRSKAARGRT